MSLISQNILKILEVRRISQKELAAGMGITNSHLSKLLSGIRRWNEDLINSAADFFDRTPAEILSGEMQQNEPLSVQVANAISEAEAGNLQQEIEPQRNVLFRRLIDHCSLTGDRPTVPLIKRLLPLLLGIILTMSSLVQAPSY